MSKPAEDLKTFTATATEREAYESILVKMQAIHERNNSITNDVRARLGLSQDDKITYDPPTGTFLVKLVAQPSETPKS